MEFWFHVEQCPIHETAPHLGSADNQLMASRIEAQYRKLLTEPAEIVDIRTVHPCLPVGTGMLDAGLLRHAGIGQPTGLDADLAGALSDQTITDTTAETATVAEDVDGLEYGGLAGTIGAQ